MFSKLRTPTRVEEYVSLRAMEDSAYRRGRSEGHSDGHITGFELGSKHGRAMMFFELVHDDLMAAYKRGVQSDLILSPDGLEMLLSKMPTTPHPILSQSNMWVTPFGNHRLTIDKSLTGFRWEVIDRV